MVKVVQSGIVFLLFLTLHSCGPKVIPRSDVSKVESFLIIFELDEELPSRGDPVWAEYETWIREFGVQRFLDTLPRIAKERPELKDECEFFEKEFTVNFGVSGSGDNP